MIEEEMQEPLNLDEELATAELETQDLTPDESAASLAFATGLSERMMEQKAMEQGVGHEPPQEPQEAQGGEETPGVVEKPIVEEQAPMEADIEAIREEVSALRDEIQEVLNEDEETKPQEDARQE